MPACSVAALKACYTSAPYRGQRSKYHGTAALLWRRPGTGVTFHWQTRAVGILTLCSMANLRELDRGRAPQTCLAYRGVPAAWPRRLREQKPAYATTSHLLTDAQKC